MLQRGWRECNRPTLLVGMQMVLSLWRTVWRFLKKLKTELPYNPAIPLLGIYPEKTKIQEDAGTVMFTAALFTIARTWKQPKSPLSGMDKDVIHIHYEIHFQSCGWTWGCHTE